MLIYNPSQQLTKHFRMREVAESSVAARNNIDNIPSPQVLEAALLVATHILEPIRVHFNIPFAPTSWYRGEALERLINNIPYRKWCARRGVSVNQKTWKQYFELKSHPKGEAVDFEIPGVPNDQLFTWIEENIPDYDQLIREFPVPGDPMSGWVHVSFSAKLNRKQKFIIT